MTARVEKYDVVVAGAGAGGIAAAVGAARTGAKTLLLERYGFMGGAATNAQVLAYCGFYARGTEKRQTVMGVGEELLNELDALGSTKEPIVSKSGYWVVMMDPEAAKLAFDRLASKNGVEPRLHSRLIGAEVENGRIRSVQVADHAGITTIEAGAFVDASGEATLATLAGVPLSQVGGSPSSVQAASLPFRIGGVAPDAVFDRARMAEIIVEHNKTAKYPILRADGGVHVRLPITNDAWWMAIDLETDGVTGKSLTEVEMTAREIAWSNMQALRQLPGYESAYIASTGPQIGIRETRRPFSRADVTEQDCVEGSRYADGIARGSWPVEVHEAPGRARFVDLGGEGFFDIRKGAIEAAEIDNLFLAGRVIGADHKAYGSVRVMGTAFATGHAAGVSAALEVTGNRDLATLQATLKAQNAII